MFQGRVAKIGFQPGQGLKGRVVMLVMPEKARADSDLSVGGHSGAGHIEQAHAAIIVAGLGPIFVGGGWARHQAGRDSVARGVSRRGLCMADCAIHG